MSKNILNYFKGIPRPLQSHVLTQIQKLWGETDIFVINAPVGSGKSRIAHCLSNWHFTTDIITPTNMLVDQYVVEFPELPKLLKRSLYPCCREYGRRKHACDRAGDNRRVFGMRRSIQNYYMYMSTFTRGRKPGDCLVVDEAHNLIPTLQSLMAKKLWRHDWFWPEDIGTGADLGKWAQNLLHKNPGDPILQLVVDQCFSRSPTYVFEKTQELWSKVAKGKKPYYRDVILLKPIEVSRGPSYYWGKHINKLVLMSATISRKDIEAMGLHRRRIQYLECDSPIPVKNRAIVIDPITEVSRVTLQDSAKKIATHIEEVLLPRHLGEKGVIHATYEMADLLKKHLLPVSTRFMFHDKWNKNKVYQDFRGSTSDKILVASGLYEGIDLPGDLGRWQVIAKVPWLSLGDRAIRYKAEHNTDWYNWETLKDLIQASGRVCRGPKDHGITYILDSTFKKLYDGGKEFVPEWFDEAINFPGEHL